MPRWDTCCAQPVNRGPQPPQWSLHSTPCSPPRHCHSFHTEAMGTAPPEPAWVEAAHRGVLGVLWGELQEGLRILRTKDSPCQGVKAAFCPLLHSPGRGAHSHPQFTHNTPIGSTFSFHSADKQLRAMQRPGTPLLRVSCPPPSTPSVSEVLGGESSQVWPWEGAAGSQICGHKRAGCQWPLRLERTGELFRLQPTTARDQRLHPLKVLMELGAVWARGWSRCSPQSNLALAEAQQGEEHPGEGTWGSVLRPPLQTLPPPKPKPPKATCPQQTWGLGQGPRLQGRQGKPPNTLLPSDQTLQKATEARV